VTQSRGALPAGPMVIFVHMASVWVPFTSESKEAIAEYDEISKEITLALRECGRRLGAFLRRRERAYSEQSRRDIFQLYIEEVVDSCNRLKGGKLPVAKLKEQLQKMAMKVTGGIKTDEVLGKNGSGPEGLPHSIIVTPEGVEGEVPKVIAEASPPANGNGPHAAGTKDAEASTVTSKTKTETEAAKGRGHGRARREGGGRAAHRAKTDRRPRSAHATAASKARARRGKG
jgi:DNA topoisomerase VI subunit B